MGLKKKKTVVNFSDIIGGSIYFQAALLQSETADSCVNWDWTSA